METWYLFFFRDIEIASCTNEALIIYHDRSNYPSRRSERCLDNSEICECCLTGYASSRHTRMPLIKYKPRKSLLVAADSLLKRYLAKSMLMS